MMSLKLFKFHFEYFRILGLIEKTGAFNSNLELYFSS